VTSLETALEENKHQNQEVNTQQLEEARHLAATNSKKEGELIRATQGLKF
jgi:hypothetical protein